MQRWVNRPAFIPLVLLSSFARLCLCYCLVPFSLAGSFSVSRKRKGDKPALHEYGKQLGERYLFTTNISNHCHDAIHFLVSASAENIRTQICLAVLSTTLHCIVGRYHALPSQFQWLKELQMSHLKLSSASCLVFNVPFICAHL